MAPPTTRIPSPTKRSNPIPPVSQPHDIQSETVPSLESPSKTPDATPPAPLAKPNTSNAPSTSAPRSRLVKPPAQPCSSSVGTTSKPATTNIKTSSTAVKRPINTTSFAGGALPPKNTPEKPYHGKSKLQAPLHSTSAPSTPRPKPPATTSTTTTARTPHVRNPSALSKPTTSNSPSTPRQTSQTSPTPKPQFTTTTRSPPTPRHATPQKQPHNAAQSRSQLHLLHLSLAHTQSFQAKAAYLHSAESQLATRFATLQALYTETLHLERAHRQAANLLSLHAWTGGNLAALSRRLNVLGSVLAELMRLTAPAADEAGAPQAGEELGQGSSSAEGGEYTQCVAAFEHWVDWVRRVWAARDNLPDNADLAQSTSATTLDGKAPDAAAEPHVDSADPFTYTAIEGLGDATKATARALTTQLHALDIRLQDLEGGTTDGGNRNAAGTDASLGGGSDDAAVPGATPVYLLGAARQLVDGLTEELQIMREVEFEVVVGEKAWVGERVRRIGREIENF